MTEQQLSDLKEALSGELLSYMLNGLKEQFPPNVRFTLIANIDINEHEGDVVAVSNDPDVTKMVAHLHEKPEEAGIEGFGEGVGSHTLQ